MVCVLIPFSPCPRARASVCVCGVRWVNAVMRDLRSSRSFLDPLRIARRLGCTPCSLVHLTSALFKRMEITGYCIWFWRPTQCRVYRVV